MLNKTGVALLSVISNIFLTVGKVVIGLAAGAVSIVSEGIHSGMDLIAALIAYFAVRESSKPADKRHAYGHGKIENVSGTIEALLIFVAALWIIYEAVHKISAGIKMEKFGLAMAIMAVSAIVNLIVSTLLMKVGKKTESIALQADALHLRTDVVTSAGVFAGLLLIKLTGWTIIDPIIAIIVALFIMKSAYQLTKEAFMPLVDVSLPDEEYETIVNVLNKYKKDYVEFHDLRTRRSGSERHIDLHLVVPKHISMIEAHNLCDQIEKELGTVLAGANVLIHAEPCSDSVEHHCQKDRCIKGCDE